MSNGNDEPVITRQQGIDPNTGEFPDLSNVENVDYLFLSHAHLDHTGAIGMVMEKFPDVKIMTSDITLEASYMMLSGSRKSQANLNKYLLFPL